MPCEALIFNRREKIKASFFSVYRLMRVDSDALNGTVVECLERGDLAGALVLVDDALRVGAPAADAATEARLAMLRELRVSILLSLHRYDDALRALHDETRRRPHSADTWLALASLAMQLGRRDEADAAFRRLQRLDPVDPRARELMAAYFAGIDEGVNN